MAKKAIKSCDCLKLVNEELRSQNVALDTAMQINFKTRQASVGGPFLAVHFIERMRNNKKLPTITCTYCPFCGKKK